MLAIDLSGRTDTYFFEVVDLDIFFVNNIPQSINFSLQSLLLLSCYLQTQHCFFEFFVFDFQLSDSIVSFDEQLKGRRLF